MANRKPEKMKNLLRMALGFALVMLPAPHAALAASSTVNFNVKLAVAPACTVSATDLNFGTFTGSIPANTAATAVATVTCNIGTTYAMSFTAGANPAAAVGTIVANMANGANPTIPANLRVSIASRIGTGASVAINIRGRIVAAVTRPPVGTYSVRQAIYVLY